MAATTIRLTPTVKAEMRKEIERFISDKGGDATLLSLREYLATIGDFKVMLNRQAVKNFIKEAAVEIVTRLNEKNTKVNPGKRKRDDEDRESSDAKRSKIQQEPEPKPKPKPKPEPEPEPESEPVLDFLRLRLDFPREEDDWDGDHECCQLNYSNVRDRQTDETYDRMEVHLRPMGTCTVYCYRADTDRSPCRTLQIAATSFTCSESQ